MLGFRPLYYLGPKGPPRWAVPAAPPPLRHRAMTALEGKRAADQKTTNNKIGRS